MGTLPPHVTTWNHDASPGSVRILKHLLKELPVPLDVEHYERAGVGNAAWRHTGTTTPDRPGARR